MGWKTLGFLLGSGIVLVNAGYLSVSPPELRAEIQPLSAAITAAADHVLSRVPAASEAVPIAAETPPDVSSPVATVGAGQGATDGADTVGVAPSTWSPVWKPFTSEVSAHGFANYVAGLTGRSLRVIELQEGRHFEVQVAHTDGAMLADVRRQVAEMTGSTHDQWAP